MGGGGQRDKRGEGREGNGFKCIAKRTGAGGGRGVGGSRVGEG